MPANSSIEYMKQYRQTERYKTHEQSTERRNYKAQWARDKREASRLEAIEAGTRQFHVRGMLCNRLGSEGNGLDQLPRKNDDL